MNSLALGQTDDPWEDLEQLPANWDGQCAEVVAPEAIGHARRFIDSLGDAGSGFESFAHPNGSVGLEAENPGKAAYILVSATDRFAYVLRSGGAVHRGSDVLRLKCVKCLKCSIELWLRFFSYALKAFAAP